MAKTRTSHIKNMVAGEVADDTREIYRVSSDEVVLSAVDAWDAYQAKFDAWLEDNPGMTMDDYEPVWSAVNNNQRPPEFAAVVDRLVITDPEAIFVECRFFMDHDDGSQKEGVNAPWCQVNDTNIPTLNAGDLAVLKKVFNARRTKLGLNPAV